MASRGRTGRRPVLTCGILEHGFARIRCGACAHEYLLAFPCRCFCPSCHANRLAIWAQWLDTTLLAPVSHWHVVLTILTRLRAYCRYGRRLLGEIARVATRTVTAALRTLTGERDLVVGIVACLQTHGSRANWHPHLHLIVTDGGFRPEGTFVSWPVHDTARLTEAVGRAVLLLFFRLAVCDEDQATGMLAWPHSGFHVQTATCRRRRGSPQTTVPSRSASRAIARGTPWRRGATAERTAPRRLPPRPPAAGRRSCSSSSTNQRTACRAAELSGPVRITHPFPPLLGQEIDFVDRQQRWGEDRVLYRDPDGYLLSLPARWTTVEAEDPFVIVAAGRSPFRAADLIDLAALVATLGAGGGSDAV